MPRRNISKKEKKDSIRIYNRKLSDVMKYLKSRYTFVRNSSQFIKLIKLKIKMLMSSFSPDIQIGTEDIYWIDPAKIKYIYESDKCLDIWLDKGKVIGGNWDALSRFEESDVYKALRNVLINKDKWENTSFYRRVLNQILNGEEKWGCRNELEFRERLKDIEFLFEYIKKHGYKSKKLLEVNSKQKEDEVTVNIGRYGDLLLNNGRHRLSIAKLLNIKKIPIKITAKHQKWVDFKNQILNYAEKMGGVVYQPLTHVDLQSIPSQYKDDRFDFIKKNTTSKKGTLLDIGTHWGYFCHKFEEEGYDCYAVENDIESLYFLGKLKRAEDRRFKIISKSIFDSYDEIPKKFDVVLALNIFHHFIKHEDDYHKLVNLLNKLEMEEMFFQSHRTDEPQMKGAFKNFTPEEFVYFILQNSCLKKMECIGKTDQDGRFLYRLYK